MPTRSATRENCYRSTWKISCRSKFPADALWDRPSAHPRSKRHGDVPTTPRFRSSVTREYAAERRPRSLRASTVTVNDLAGTPALRASRRRQHGQLGRCFRAGARCRRRRWAVEPTTRLSMPAHGLLQTRYGTLVDQPDESRCRSEATSASRPRLKAPSARFRPTGAALIASASTGRSSRSKRQTSSGATRSRADPSA